MKEDKKPSPSAKKAPASPASKPAAKKVAPRPAAAPSPKTGSKPKA